jgi:hypothetical protein
MSRRRTQKTGAPAGQQRKMIRQDLQDYAGSLFLPESADDKHVNPVDHFLPRTHLDAFNPTNSTNPRNDNR